MPSDRIRPFRPTPSRQAGDTLPPHDGAVRARAVAGGAALLALALAAGCRGATEREGPMRIGVTLGANITSPSMRSVVNGITLAIDDLNAEAQRRGLAARFALRTAPKSMTSAVQIATTLRDDESVVGVVGHTDSGGSLEAAPIYEDKEHGGEHAVVAVSPTATSPLLSGRTPWMFRVCPSDVAASQAAARYVFDSLGARRAAVIYRNDAYGKGWTRAFVDAFRRSGGTIVERDPYITGMAEWDAYAGYVAQLRPDIVLFPGSPDDARAFIRAARAAGTSPALLGGDAVSELETSPDEFRGVHYTAFFQAERASSPEATAFVDAFRRRFGTVPDQRAALSYDAAMLIGRAALEVGPDRRRIRDRLAAVGRGAPAVAGVTGRIAFDERNDVVDKPVVIGSVGGGMR